MNLWPDNMDASAWYYAQIQEATNSHDFVWAGEFEQWTQNSPSATGTPFSADESNRKRRRFHGGAFLRSS